jgi:hypothetical protein
LPQLACGDGELFDMSTFFDKKLIVSVGVVSAVVFAVGVIIGYYGKQGPILWTSISAEKLFRAKFYSQIFRRGVVKWYRMYVTTELWVVRSNPDRIHICV